VAPPELLKISDCRWQIVDLKDLHQNNQQSEIFNQNFFMGAIAQGQSAQTCFIDFVGAVIRNELF